MTALDLMTLSPAALQLIAAIVGEQSNIQLPAAVAAQVLEIRAWVKAQLEPRG